MLDSVPDLKYKLKLRYLPSRYLVLNVVIIGSQKIFNDLFNFNIYLVLLSKKRNTSRICICFWLNITAFLLTSTAVWILLYIKKLMKIVLFFCQKNKTCDLCCLLFQITLAWPSHVLVFVMCLNFTKLTALYHTIPNC